jgi:hypothetical protein
MTGTMRAILPRSSKTISVSIVSKSMAPRELPVEPVKRLDVRQQPRAAARGGAGLVFEHGRDLRVGEPRVGADRGREEAIRFDLPATADLHIARHRQARHVGIERAQPVRKLLRQHRDDAPGKVDRVAAQPRLLIKRIAVLHIVAHVGNGDDQPEARVLALARRLAVDCVVEVPGAFPVDGDERKMREVRPAFAILGCDHIGQRPTQALGLVRKQVRQRMLAQRDLDLHARVGVVAEHFDDFRDGLRMLGRLRDDLGRYDLAGLCSARFVRRNEKLVRDALVFGRDEQNAVRPIEPPDDPLLAPLQHFDDLAFRTRAPVGAGDAAHGTVAMQDLMHLLRAQEKIGAAIIPHEKAETIRMTLDPAAHEIELRHDADRAAAVAHDLPFAFHRRDAA